MDMTFGIHVGHLGGPLPDLRRLRRFGDEAGFDWFSISDHLQEFPPSGGDGDCFEAFVAEVLPAFGAMRPAMGGRP